MNNYNNNSSSSNSSNSFSRGMVLIIQDIDKQRIKMLIYRVRLFNNLMNFNKDSLVSNRN